MSKSSCLSHAREFRFCSSWLELKTPVRSSIVILLSAIVWAFATRFFFEPTATSTNASASWVFSSSAGPRIAASTMHLVAHSRPTLLSTCSSSIFNVPHLQFCHSCNRWRLKQLQKKRRLRTAGTLIFLKIMSLLVNRWANEIPCAQQVS